MQLVKTFYLGCEDNGTAANTNNTTIRFDGYTLFPHCTFMSAMCYNFWKAQLLYQDKVLDGPAKLCIVCAKGTLYNKANPKNKSRGIDQLEWFINNMEPPQCGIIVSLYQYETNLPHIEDRWSAQTIWPLRRERQWTGSGDYISLHDAEWRSSGRKVTRAAFHPTKDLIDNIEEHSIFPVKRINYTMTEEEIFSILKETKFHLAYNGGTYYSAGMIGCPTIGLYWDNEPKTYVTYHDVKTLEQIGEYVEYTMWNLGNSNSKGRVLQYNFETVFQRPQKYLKHVSRKPELLNYLKGYSDLVINGKRYSITI